MSASLSICAVDKLHVQHSNSKISIFDPIMSVPLTRLEIQPVLILLRHQIRAPIIITATDE